MTTAAQRTHFPLILALYCAGLGAAAQYGKLALFVEDFAAAYPGAGGTLGFLISAIGLIGIILGLVAGLVVARIGFRRLLLGALALGAALSLFQASLPALPLMLASRLLEGLSHLVIVVAAPTLIAQIAAERHRVFAMTLWSTFFGVSFALLAWLGAPLVAARGIGALLAAHGLFLAVIAVLLALGLPRQRALPDHAPLTLRTIFAQHARVYASPRIAAPGLGWLFYTLSFVAIMAVLPGYLDADQRGAATGVMSIAGMVVSMSVGVVLVNRFGALPIILAGFALAIFAALWLLAAPGSALVAVALMGALGLVQGPSFAAVPELNSSAEARAEANGAMAQMGNLGNTLGTPILLAMSGAMGIGGLVLFSVLAHLGGGAVHLMLAARRRRAAPASP